MENKVLERFLRYIAIDTQSDYNSLTSPSTEKQKELASLLKQECEVMGFNNVILTDCGYVYCFLKGNTSGGTSIGLIAHMDTSPDCKGSEIKAHIIKDYKGDDIKLKNGLLISPAQFDVLNNYMGCDIITTDGETLLGADDKAGIAEIMTAMEYIIKNNTSRPDIYIAFTPDEEVGRGMDNFDLSIFCPKYAFTIDGGRIGELEYESFNAARAKISIKGVAIHPGYAKGIMKNAALIASELISLLPKDETPSSTEGYEGFFHVTDVEACVSTANITLIVRDFKRSQFEERKNQLNAIVKDLNNKHGDIISIKILDEYYNMGDVISNHKWIIDAAAGVYKANKVEPLIKPIRGGTDGSRLSFMGIPCPNLFAGGHNFHGPYEFIPVSSMEKAVNVIVGIVEKFSEINYFD